MKQISMVMAWLLLAISTKAQLSLTGNVTNEQSQYLTDATVVLKNINNKKTLREKTDEEGHFLFKSLPNNSQWILHVFYAGKTPFESKVTLADYDKHINVQLGENVASLEPLEVRAVRAGDKAPFSKTNITKADIEKNNLGRDLPYMLAQTPNVVINSDAGNGVGYTGIHIRGSDGTRTNVTLNGIPYNDAESSGSYFVDIPDVVSSVGSIQIQRGVGTSSNGAGAFGATINLSTNEVHDSAYGELNNSFGSFNTWKHTVMAGSGLIDGKFTADLRLSNISSDGYIDRASSKLQSLLFSTAYIGRKTTVRFNLIVGKEKTYQAWDGVPEDSIKVNRTYNELGYIAKTGTYYNNETDNYNQNHYQLFVTHQFSPKFSLAVASFLSTGIGYYEEYKNSQDYANYGIAYPVPFATDTLFSTDLIRQQYLDNKFYGQTFSVQYKGKADELTLGGSWTNYDGWHYGKVIWAENGGIDKDAKYYNLPAYKYDKNVYLKWLHSFNDYWNLFADMQYRNVWHHMYGFQDIPSLTVKRNFNFLNPKIGISYLKDGYNAYLSYALANKEPNRDDFEAGLENQPKAERLNDFELGANKKDENYNWGINLYYMLYKNQLVLTGQLNDVGSATRTNAPNSYRAGIELQGGYVFTNWLNATANLSFSKNKIKNYTAYYNAYDADWNALPQQSTTYHNTDIAFSPDIVGAGSLNILPCKNVQISLISKYVGNQYLDNTGNDTRMLKAYYNQDARLIFTLKNKFFKEWNIIGQVYNVFNHFYNTNGATYPEYDNGTLNNYNYFFPMAGTNFMIGVNIKL